MDGQTFPIPRRTLLRGTGAALALPWLEAMIPTHARAATTDSRPTRLAVLFMPNGVRADAWTPTGQGRDFELSPILKPLENLKEDIPRPHESMEPSQRLR